MKNICCIFLYSYVYILWMTSLEGQTHTPNISTTLSPIAPNSTHLPSNHKTPTHPWYTHGYKILSFHAPSLPSILRGSRYWSQSSVVMIRQLSVPWRKAGRGGVTTGERGEGLLNKKMGMTNMQRGRKILPTSFPGRKVCRGEANLGKSTLPENWENEVCKGQQLMGELWGEWRLQRTKEEN